MSAVEAVRVKPCVFCSYRGLECDRFQLVGGGIDGEGRFRPEKVDAMIAALRKFKRELEKEAVAALREGRAAVEKAKKRG